MSEIELDDRKMRILNAIIQNYLETGEPVGSRTISKYTDLNLSSATIRNEMADLEELGYIEVGMDHFSLPTDSLYQSMVDKTIHRNFMGYSSSSTQVMIGLGMSSISDTWYGFAQNEKVLEEYYARLEKNEIPLMRGHILNQEDLVIRRHILNLMCLLETSWEKPEQQFPELPDTLERLKEMESDGLLEFVPNGLKITEKGRIFTRNICMTFDLRMLRDKPETRIFSMTV